MASHTDVSLHVGKYSTVRIKILILSLVQLTIHLPVVSQVIPRSITLHFAAPEDTAIVHMDGTLDGVNTFTYPDSQAFQPMKRLVISNEGQKTVIKPRLVVNSKRNWYDIESIKQEVFQDATTPKERALVLWKFMRDNRFHYFEPAYGREVDDAVKFLGVYGYGMCYNTSVVAASIASRLLTGGERAYYEYSPRNRHSVKDILFDTTLILIDPDKEVFYLKHDNSTVARFDDIANDKYLIKRVHHYGKAADYNRLNNRVADGTYEPTPSIPYAGLFPDYHTLDINLRPGERLEYNWLPGEYYHHFVPWNGSHNVPARNIRNGRIVYNTNFIHAPLEELIDGSVDLVTNTDNSRPNLQPSGPGAPSSVVVKMESPFVVVNGTVWGNFYRGDENDQITISVSRDSVNWDVIGTVSAMGFQEASISLADFINTLASEAVYQYYVRIDMMAASSDLCGVDSLSITSDFQVSRFFPPELELGTNVIAYSDNTEGERHVAVRIEWEESWENEPPSPVTAPIFPLDRATVDSLKFSFRWAPATDPDGIADYEFVLSDRSDMKYPLTPSFEVYTSIASGGEGTAYFTIPFDGLLNSDSVYYWRVRAKDAKGGWGEWSPVWSFRPRGPMPPTVKECSVRNDTVVLHWEPHQGGVAPVRYELHASDEAYGFMPDNLTFLFEIDSTSTAIPFTKESPPATHYRVIAIDEHGSKSAPSAYCMLPYPYVLDDPDTLAPGDPYVLKLNPTNRVYTTDMADDSFIQVQLLDPVSAEVISKPGWVQYDAVEGVLTGLPNYAQAHNDSIVVQLTGFTTGYTNRQVFSVPVPANHNPILSDMDLVAVIGQEFERTIHVSDPDAPLGDYISEIAVVSKPAWLTATYAEGYTTLYLYGIPTVLDGSDTTLIVRASDSGGGSTERQYSVRFLLDGEMSANAAGSVRIAAPNPFTDVINVGYQRTNPGQTRVTIYDSNGRLVYQTVLEDHQPGSHIKKIRPGLTENGLYYMVLETGSSSSETDNRTAWKLIRRE